MSEEDSEKSQENEELQFKEESEENKSEENLAKEENVEKEEEEPEAENHEEDNQDIEDNHREEPETKEIVEKKPKEEIYTREEPKEDEQDSQSASEEKEPEVPTEIILFSTLSKEDKIKYFNFFIANDTVFTHESQGTWIAEIDIYDDEKSTDVEITSSKQSDIKNLRQSAFRSTKKDYDTIYSKLIKVINPSPGIKGKKMDINVIKYMIQEIYSLKFLKDTQSLFDKEDVESDSFPEFVGNFLVNKFPKKEILDKKAVDFMLSLDFYGLKHKDIKVFQQFVTEEYDTDDLIFYLFVRSCIEKEFKVFFLEKAKESLGEGLLYGQEDEDIMISAKKCEKLGKAIFGSEEKELLKTFMDNIKRLLETDAADEKKKHLKANAILNMSLENYHNSRGKVDEANEDQERDSDDENRKKKKKDKKKKEKEKEKGKEKGKEKEKVKEKVKDKTKEKEKEKVQKKKKEVEEVKKKKPKHKEEDSEDEDDRKNLARKDYYEDDEEEEKITKKQPPKLRAQKKPNLKPSTNTKVLPKNNTKLSSSTKQKTSGTTGNKLGKSTTITNTIKVPTSKVASKPANKPTISTKSNITGGSNRINTLGNRITSSKAPRKGSQEARVRVNSKPKISKKPPTSSSVGKRKPASSVGKRKLPGFGNEELEQTQEFKKILAKNRVDKVKTESDKATCLLYIINDFFRMKEIDGYFKSIIDNNPMFQTFSSKINANIKTLKEFTLKKLNGICKYISTGDKSGFYNFMKIKDKSVKNNFDTLRSSYNNLLKKQLKNLGENDVSHFCKAILDIPELSVQTSKSLLKYCE